MPPQVLKFVGAVVQFGVIVAVEPETETETDLVASSTGEPMSVAKHAVLSDFVPFEPIATDVPPATKAETAS